MLTPQSSIFGFLTENNEIVKHMEVAHEVKFVTLGTTLGKMDYEMCLSIRFMGNRSIYLTLLSFLGTL